MTFIVHSPAPPLDRAVEYFYCPVGPMPFAREHVMPGVAIDLKINFGGRVTARLPESRAWEEQPATGWCMGLWSEHHAVGWPADTDFVGVALRPGGALALLGVEAYELSGQIVAIDALLGPAVAELRERLAEAGGAKARFALLEKLLTARLRDVPDADRIGPAVDLLNRTNGTVPIASLAASTNVSHKHLVTLFNRLVGAPPKTLGRLYRLQHMLTAIDTAAHCKWTNLAHDFNYFDQAHFNKDFRRFTGRTPAQYLAGRHQLRAANPAHAQHRRLLPEG